MRKLSLVTPSSNQSPSKQAKLTSVPSQPYPNPDLIVIDDASTYDSVGMSPAGRKRRRTVSGNEVLSRCRAVGDE